MKNLFLTLSLVLGYSINAFSQATSLTIDCQTPGWLSSMINYGDQQTLENIKVTGYINGTDIKFIRELNLNCRLSGIIDLENVKIVSGGESYGTFNTGYIGSYNPTTADDTITDFMFAYLNYIKKIILPTNIKSFSGNHQFTNTSVDTLIINGNMEAIGVGGGYGNKYWGINCIFFPEGLNYIDLGFLFHTNAGLRNIELYLPSTLEKITGKVLVLVKMLSFTVHLLILKLFKIRVILGNMATFLTSFV